MRTGHGLPALLALLAAAMIIAAGCTAPPATNRTTTTTPTAAATYCAACDPGATATSNTTGPHAPFNSTTWEWRALEAAAGPVAVNDSANYTITFTVNGTYGISADCNVGGGDYTANGSELNLTPPITTLIWCGEESHEQLYLGSLANVTSHGFDGEGRLVLHLVAPDERMIFSARDDGFGPTVTASAAIST